MPSSNVAPSLMWRLWALARKDARELLASRATWMLLVVIGPLVGNAFITSVRSYADASGAAGGAAALSQGLSPLDGILVPTFGAYALLATLLLPFIAIRLISAEKSSGALGLLQQGSTSMTWMIVVKAKIMMLAWIVSWLPGLLAVALWRSYDGHMNGNELLVLLAGHTLRGLFVVSLAFAAAALSENSAAAAVVTLGVTLGGWALDFVAQVQGGMAQRLARFTPESALRVFEQGEWSSAVIGVSCAIALSLLGITSVALRAGQTRQRRVRRGASVAIVGLVAVMLTSQWRATADVSEDQRNSFAPDDVRALSAVRGTILIEAHLAPEDPRLVDLQRGVIHKLERIVDVKFTTSSRTSTGMFERSADGYGEVWYGWNGARRMSRSTTAPIVLETLYDLTGTPKPPHTLDLAYPGYPLSAQPRYAAMLFYFAWPICVIGLLVARSWSTARSRAPR